MNVRRIILISIALLTAGAFALFFWDPMLALVNVYEHTPEYSHGYLVPLFAGFLLWRKRHAWQDRGSAGRRFGVAVTAFGVLTVLAAQWYNFALRPGGLGAEFLFGVALVTVAVGLCLAAGGVQLLRRWAWPVGFLAFAIPVPLSVSDNVTLPMRRFVTVTAGGVMEALFVPVVREGNVLQLPNFTVGVVDACSGIRSLFVMLAMAGVLVSLNRLRWGRALAVFALAPAVAVIQNVLRILAMGLLGNAGLQQLTVGFWHEVMGLATFGVAVALFTCSALLIENAGRGKQNKEKGAAPDTGADDDPENGGASQGVSSDSDNARHGRASATGDRRPPSPVRYGPLAGVCLLLVMGGLGAHLIEKHYRIYRPQLTARQSLSKFPEKIGSYVVAEQDKLGDMARDMLAPSEELIRGYRGADGRHYGFSVLYWEPFLTRCRPEGIRLHHPPDLCYSGGGWQKMAEYDEVLPVPGLPGQKAEIRIYRSMNEVQALLFWKTPYPDLGDIAGSISDRIQQIVSSWTDPPLNTGSQWTIMIVTAVKRTPEEARDALLQFFETVAPLMPKYGIPPQAEEQSI